MGVRPGYKLTQIGVIPADWHIDIIHNLAEITTGNKNTQDRIEDGTYPFFVRSSTIERINSYSFDGESVLTAGDGVGTGKIYHYINGKFDFHQRVYNISNFSDHLSGYFFYLYFSNNFYSRIMQMTAKSSVDSVRREMIADMQIPVPPIIEQHAIATALSDVDALLIKLDVLIAKKRDLKQAAMQQLLTGKTRLPGFSEEWEVKLFGEFTSPRLERFDPRKSGEQFFCVELEHIDQSSGHLVGYTTTKMDASLKTVFRANDVLFGKLRAYLRKYWLADCDGVCSTEIWALVANSRIATPDFVYHIVTSDQFIEAASNSYGTHMPRSEWKLVKNCPFSLPPIHEQMAITSVLSDMGAEIAALEIRRDKIKFIKQGMMQELLTGRIRLI